MHRRHLLKAGAVAAGFPYFVPRRAFGASDRVHVGIIGVGGRANWLIRNEEWAGAQIVAIADCFQPRLAAAAKLRPDGDRWGKYSDYREMLSKEKLDAVFVETTTHARVLVMMQVLQAGVDVYGEKPLTLTVDEGRTLIGAVRRYKRVLQTGTQQRSIPINAYASRLIREGKIGKVHTVTVCNYEGPKQWDNLPPEPVPAGLDWDQWCNQTQLRPYHRELHYRWAWWWDYDGGGQSWGVTGWGTHSLDQVQCALGTDDTGPVEIWAEGDSPMAPVKMRYASGTLVQCVGPKRDHADLGAIFHGANGAIEIKRGSVVADPPELMRGAPPDTIEGPGENRFHFDNFFDCVRTRKRPNAHVEAGHRATTLCHLYNMARDLKRRLRWDPKAERFLGDEDANRLLARPRRKGFELPKVV